MAEPDSVSPTLVQAIEEYLDWQALDRGRSPHTVRAYGADLVGSGRLPPRRTSSSWGTSTVISSGRFSRRWLVAAAGVPSRRKHATAASRHFGPSCASAHARSGHLVTLALPSTCRNCRSDSPSRSSRAAAIPALTWGSPG